MDLLAHIAPGRNDILKVLRQGWRRSKRRYFVAVSIISLMIRFILSEIFNKPRTYVCFGWGGLGAHRVWIEVFSNQGCDTEKSLRLHQNREHHLDEFFVSGRLDMAWSLVRVQSRVPNEIRSAERCEGESARVPFFCQENVHKSLSGFKRNPALISNGPPSTVI
ncbi:hypothetical protein DOZ80_09300 [Pseudomonas fluorescens]|uniref:Uncharacterized protein n=1 Tax=Pseudomonas fluorescens TaxID=294 RepID=A0A327N915_PSEFL|nr:hypothetical protein DOZ80_09300 [Pseudomonas fluorescens]